MPRSPELYIQDIFDAITKIEHYSKWSLFSPFIDRDLKYDGVIRNLEIIGEAAKHIPANLKQKYPLEWLKITGLRDILAHAYFGVEEKIIWDIVKNKIPELKRVIRAMKQEISGGSQR